MSKAEVTLYTRVGCHLCDVAKEVLEDVGRARSFGLAIVDVDTNGELVERYGHEVPVVTINGRKAFKFRVDEQAFRAHLDRAEAEDAPPGQR